MPEKGVLEDFERRRFRKRIEDLESELETIRDNEIYHIKEDINDLQEKLDRLSNQTAEREWVRTKEVTILTFATLCALYGMFIGTVTGKPLATIGGGLALGFIVLHLFVWYR